MAVLSIALLLGAGAAHAETYPAHPITLLVPAAPGGGNDTVARVVADKLKAPKPPPVRQDRAATRTEAGIMPFRT
jgi:tripartite-type tricarboxylate transporter receptor subunit TctC